MRKGLIFYALCGFCALSSVGALTSCASTNSANSKEGEIMTDYTDLETFRSDVINGVDVVGKTMHFTPDNGEYRDGFRWNIDYQNMVFVGTNCSDVDQGYYMNNNPIDIKVYEVREPSPSHNNYIVYFYFVTKDLIDRGIIKLNKFNN